MRTPTVLEPDSQAMARVRAQVQVKTKDTTLGHWLLWPLKSLSPGSFMNYQWGQSPQSLETEVLGPSAEEELVLASPHPVLFPPHERASM